MRDFLAAIWPEGLETIEPLLGEIRAFKGDHRVQNWVSSPGEAEAQALVLAVSGYDVYFGVLPRLEEKGGGDAIPDVTSVLWADFDNKSFEYGAFAALWAVRPQPQIVVDSGNGYHGYWLLRDLVPFAEAREVMKGMHLVAGADKTYDKARILRVPGTENHKTDPPHPVRLLKFDLTGRRYRIDEFVDYASAAMPARPERAAYVDEGREVEGWERSSRNAPKFPEGSRNNSLARVAGIMYARGMAGDDVLEALLWENEVRCDPPLDQPEVEQIVRSVGRYAR